MRRRFLSLRLYRTTTCVMGALCATLGCSRGLAQASRRPLEPSVATSPESPQHRTRLYLRDGSFQTVTSFQVVGDRVRYRSAERNGSTEELPLAFVDLEATKAWQDAHDPSRGPSPASQTSVLSPELAREEAERAAQNPEVAKDLRLPDGNSVLVLDTYQGTPELIPLPQTGTELNRETAHDVAPRPIAPNASPHDLLLLRDERADVQLHVPDPVFFVRLQQAPAEAGGSAFVVDTEGQVAGRGSRPATAVASSYLLEHVDVRQGARAVASVRLGLLGTGRTQPDIVELKAEPVPGKAWLKLTPTQPLEFGEYVLLEVLSDRSVNADVWDFGVHPTARENDEALRPEPKHPARLERRPR